MKFLVPTDYSVHAKNAAEYAAALAQATNSDLLFLHVITPPVFGVHRQSYLYTEEISRLSEEAEKNLKAMSDKFQPAHKRVTFDYLVSAGETVDEIIKTAVEKKTDIIIMGTRGAGGLKKIFFGSNTASVIEKSELPVLAVPEKASFTPANKIVFATDFYDSDLESLRQLSSIASAFNGEIIIIHIVDSDEKIESEHDLIQWFSGLVRKETSYPKISCRIFREKSSGALPLRTRADRDVTG